MVSCWGEALRRLFIHRFNLWESVRPCGYIGLTYGGKYGDRAGLGGIKRETKTARHLAVTGCFVESFGLGSFQF